MKGWLTVSLDCTAEVIDYEYNYIFHLIVHLSWDTGYISHFFFFTFMFFNRSFTIYFPQITVFVYTFSVKAVWQVCALKSHLFFSLCYCLNYFPMSLTVLWWCHESTWSLLFLSTATTSHVFRNVLVLISPPLSVFCVNSCLSRHWIIMAHSSLPAPVLPSTCSDLPFSLNDEWFYCFTFQLFMLPLRPHALHMILFSLPFFTMAPSHVCACIGFLPSSKLSLFIKGISEH